MSATRYVAVASLAVACCALGASRVRAVDHTNLEEGLPVEVVDAYPIEYLGREVRGQLQYRYTPSGEHEARLVPSFELGIPYNGQVAVHAPLVARTTSDDVELDVDRAALDFFYNLNQETLVIPALALAMGVQAPHTRDGGSFDPFGRAVLTKAIPGTTLFQRVHLNALVQLNVERKVSERERELRYVLVAGYDVRLSATLQAVVDVVRELPLERESPSNLGELGLRSQVTPLLVLAVGGGAGATDAGDLLARGTASFQWFAF